MFSVEISSCLTAVIKSNNMLISSRHSHEHSMPFSRRTEAAEAAAELQNNMSTFCSKKGCRILGAWAEA
jgi:hypothetical protein